MTWLTFFMILAGLYLVYYIVNIALDYSGSGKIAVADSRVHHHLTFTEDVKPQRMAAIESTKSTEGGPEDYEEELKPAPISPVEANGGVLIKDVFALAQVESIQYTKSINY